ncbi:uncharacterized protein F5147DRAFT_83269 [Suillus discolor]|uniref:Uncharacterized protein n=1 Tax=Suillus discolor TaxID=1912936 RepID=A0A9P7JLI4_9AGAM|nr:uncharacterized protein F5147DRAFT_83269 [Suillus discolor]KAG2085822.1 hypothetical protein F5147DRAFT_83269 [Suillus discolor]
MRTYGCMALTHPAEFRKIWDFMGARLMDVPAGERLQSFAHTITKPLVLIFLFTSTAMFDWSKLWDNILSCAFSVLATAGRLVIQVLRFIYHNWCSAMTIIFQQFQEKLRAFVGVIFNISRTYWAKMCCSILSGVLFVLIAVNNWSIVHPYIAAGVLILLAAVTNIGAFLTLLQLMGKFAVILCLLPVQLIIRYLGFGPRGVVKGSLASAYQSSHYGGTVPRGSLFARLQSTGATMLPVPLTLVSLLSYTGAVIILGREWGWWFQ